jgi:hypothetical protein
MKVASDGISNIFSAAIDGTFDANHQAFRQPANHHGFNFFRNRSPTAGCPKIPYQGICSKEFHFSQFST